MNEFVAHVNVQDKFSTVSFQQHYVTSEEKDISCFSIRMFQFDDTKEEALIDAQFISGRKF